MKITKQFKVGVELFNIELEKSAAGKITIPVFYKPLKNSPLRELTVTCDENDFDEDLKNLTPLSFGNDRGQDCVDQLKKVIIKHHNTHNRVLAADLEFYISLTILIFTSIGEGTGHPLSIDLKYILFKNFLVGFSSELGIKVQWIFED